MEMFTSILIIDVRKSEKIFTAQNLPLEKKKWIASYHPSFQKVSLPKDWRRELLKCRKRFNEFAPSLVACVKEKETKIAVISQKLERLLNGYLEQDIEKEIYRSEKSKLLLSKKSLEENDFSFTQANDWLEPMQKWLKNCTECG